MTSLKVTIETTGKVFVFDVNDYGTVEDTVIAIKDHLNNEVGFQDIICSECYIHDDE